MDIMYRAYNLKLLKNGAEYQCSIWANSALDASIWFMFNLASKGYFLKGIE